MTVSSLERTSSIERPGRRRRRGAHTTPSPGAPHRRTRAATAPGHRCSGPACASTAASGPADTASGASLGGDCGPSCWATSSRPGRGPERHSDVDPAAGAQPRRGGDVVGLACGAEEDDLVGPPERAPANADERARGRCRGTPRSHARSATSAAPAPGASRRRTADPTGAGTSPGAPPLDWARAVGASARVARPAAATARQSPTYELVRARRVAALPRLRPMRSCCIRAYGVS